jgi:hypothetical protein
MSYTTAASLRLNVEVQGLGPKFCAIVTLSNTGTKYNGDLQLMVRTKVSGFRFPVSVPGDRPAAHDEGQGLGFRV